MQRLDGKGYIYKEKGIYFLQIFQERHFWDDDISTEY